MQARGTMARVSAVAASLLWVLCVAPAAAQWETSPPPPQTGQYGAPASPWEAPPGHTAALPPVQLAPPSLLETAGFLVQTSFFVSSTAVGELDGALRAHGYRSSDRAWGGNASCLWRAVGVLWLGGRLELRARDWDRDGGVPASALGLSGMGVAHLRLVTGRSFEVGISAGAGLGGAGLEVNESTEVAFAVALHAGAHMGMNIVEPVRAFISLGYDFLQGFDFNESGHDIDLSGVAFAVGLEVLQ